MNQSIVDTFIKETWWKHPKNISAINETVAKQVDDTWSRDLLDLINCETRTKKRL